MNWDWKSHAAVCAMVLGGVAAFVIFGMHIASVIGNNAHAQIVRDQQIKVACINNGGQLIAGSCIKLGGK